MKLQTKGLKRPEEAADKGLVGADRNEASDNGLVGTRMKLWIKSLWELDGAAD